MLSLKTRKVYPKSMRRIGEVAQWLRAHTALTEDLGSFRRTHIGHIAHNYLQL